MGKNSLDQNRLLELGSAYGFDTCVELLDFLGKRGMKRELEELKGLGIDTSEFDNVTPLFKQSK